MYSVGAVAMGPLDVTHRVLIFVNNYGSIYLVLKFFLSGFRCLFVCTDDCNYLNIGHVFYCWVFVAQLKNFR